MYLHVCEEEEEREIGEIKERKKKEKTPSIWLFIVSNSTPPNNLHLCPLASVGLTL